MGETMTAIVTAYCACHLCCGQNAIGLTAAGTKPVQGVTIAAPRSVPFGTMIHVETVGWRRVEDRLSKRFDNRFDLYFRRHADAVKFGKQQLKVTYERTNRIRR
jgi:3D (Asp-Asp-Asp) domain-containing protein